MKWLLRLLRFGRVEIHVLDEKCKRIFRFPFVWWSKADAGDDEALFQCGSFRLSSGIESSFKINAHRLTANDWKTLAHMAVFIVPPFSSVIGVPTGGFPFADALRPHARTYGPVLVVDDVLTTGASIRKVAQHYENPILLVAFSRTSTHNDIFAVFTLGEAL